MRSRRRQQQPRLLCWLLPVPLQTARQVNERIDWEMGEDRQ